MKVGLINFFPMRPHVEHMYFISKCLTKLGHDIHYLSCAGGESKCYYKIISQKSDRLACFQCKLGGFKSYDDSNISYVDIDKRASIEDKMFDWPRSSSYTAFRVEEGFEEIFMEKSNKIYDELLLSVATVYEQTKEWIKKNSIEYVMVFNGRMDILRASLEACNDLNIPVNTVERTWFGDGIQLNFRGNCLNLKDITFIHEQYKDKPLTKFQLEKVKSAFLPRFSNEDNNEWRNYNRNRSEYDWNTSVSGLKCLILPSSKNEVLGHPDWKNPHNDSYKDVFLKCIDKLGIERHNVILRGHPNWSERIGSAEGMHINDDFKKWSKEVGINYIESHDSADTLGLIKQADVVLLNGSSSVFEAAFLGTPAILVSPCFYYSAGISKNVFTEEEIQRLDLSCITKYNHGETLVKAARFIYTHGFRYAQFNESVKAITTTEYIYKFDESIMSKLKYFLENNDIASNDENYSDSTKDEEEFVNAILKGDFSYNRKSNAISDDFVKVNRRFFYKPIDWIRSLMKRGDL
ncbi:hypothetical protein M902_1488 [Bacteriovorax sp. BAL6_X]|nr:hypothetical protein M902_1488 [Bacteriovorax sp. BAL6_X]